MRQIAVLFARADSIYKTLPDCDVYDINRDALTYFGIDPVIAHPPCRAWGRLRQFAKPRDGEKELALFSVGLVRRNGGVLEHPAHSTLWKHENLPTLGNVDKWGGWTLPIQQCDFGHRAQKPTWLYIVGCHPDRLPERPGKREATHCIRPTRSYPRMPSVTKAEREHTPPELAAWLVELARRCDLTTG